MKTICTTDIVPVDLNCWLLHTERLLARCKHSIALSLLTFRFDTIRLFEHAKQPEKADSYHALAVARCTAIQRVFFNKERGFFFDYNWKLRAHTNIWCARHSVGSS